ncbi:MAG TPA: hypothetical protein DCY48_03440 [Candidatus Magasanikbacteria bacterium]|nr:hypothetical protein [Candidatus Magasanikbacteria bacterium]
MKQKIGLVIILLSVLVVFSLWLGIMATGVVKGFRIVFGLIYITVLPGLVLSYILFPGSEKKIDMLERLVLSIGLSFAIVPLIIFSANYLGLPVSPLSIFFCVGGSTMAGVLFLIARRWWAHLKKAKT